MSWALAGPPLFADPLAHTADHPPTTLRELVQVQAVVIVGEGQSLLKGCVVLATFGSCQVDLPEQALSTARELTVTTGERNPFYLLPSIHAP